MAVNKANKHAGIAPDDETLRPGGAGVDLRRIGDAIAENPLLYGAAALFIALCVLAGVLISVSRAASDREFMTQYAAAFDMEDEALRAAELERLAEQDNRWTPEVTYLAGETALRAKLYDKAQAAFERVRTKFPDSPFAPGAAEGLAFLKENAGDYAGAAAAYEELASKWPDSFLATRQQMNIGRVQEAAGDLAKAVAAYTAQKDAYPDTKVAEEAEAALARLKASNPDLFPKEAEAPAAEAPAAEAPAAEAPAAEAPAAEAPAAPEAAQTP